MTNGMCTPVRALHNFLNLGIRLDTATLISCCILISIWYLLFIITIAENLDFKRYSIISDIKGIRHSSFLSSFFNSKIDIHS